MKNGKSDVDLNSESSRWKAQWQVIGSDLEENWAVDDVTDYINKFDNKVNLKNDTSEITTKSVRDDLQSAPEDEDDEEGMVMEEDEDNENENESEDEDDEYMSEGNEEKTVWRDRPCKVCGKVDCEGHPTARPSENKFVCLVCSDIFESPKLLDAHSKIHDAEMSGGSGLLEREYFYRQQKELTCKVCKKILATKMILKEHMLIHTGEKPHVCMLCGRAFRHKANLVVHINAHTIVKTFECPMCPQTFSMRVDLEDHKKTHTDQQYVCNVCGDSFHSKRVLWTHQQIHNKRIQRKKRRGNRKGGLPCRICGKFLSTKNTLKEHIMIHSGEKPHECLLCGKTIRHKANFIIHVQSHSAIETYMCNLCDLEFSRKRELKYHKQEAHGSKPFHCILCGESFRKEEGLMNHVESRHGDNPVKKKDDDDDYNQYDTIFQPHLLEGLGAKT
ncbi:uncharacterized protein LOC142333354 [Lycorma delicatula]|uniref:uncharacterized protein LOC142333354 n=1 Tax=Lycorma delicatula TaxID=130591 RepID=UPI003F50DE26